MNKKLIILFALVPALAFAEERTVEQAAVIAEQFISTQAMGHRAPGSVALTYSYTQAMPTLDREAFYVFSTGQKGFVMVSAETNTPDIIGYSNENTFVAQDLPAHIQAWFDNYARQIEWLAQHPEVKAYAPSKTYTPIEPLLKKIEWGQDEPYNYLCPIMPGEKSRSVVGCTATAMVQIMGYYQWPKHSKGQHSLPYDRSQSIDYDKDGAYDWDNILLGNYYFTRTTPKQDTAIAKLMWHAGVACDMQYSANGSGASEVEMARRAIQHFDYDSTMQEYYLDYMGAEAMTDLLNEQLTLKQPCLLTGYTTNWEGHAFVCDGIDEKGLFHINWGWDGVANGNFQITLLDPNNQGTGGSASDLAFTQYVAAVTNIKPNEHGKPTPNPIVIDSFYYEGNNLVIGKNEKLTPAIKGVYTIGLWDRFKGDVGLGIYQNGQFVKWLWSYSENTEYGSDEVKRTSIAFPKDLPNGEYELYPTYQGQGCDEILRAQVVSVCQIQLEVTDTQVIINGGIDLTLSDLELQMGDYYAYFTWNSKAPYFRVKIDSDTRTVVDSVISSTAFLFKNDSIGVYYYHIQPLTKKKTPSAWQGQRGEFFLMKECAIEDLQVEPTEDEFAVTIRWVSEAPKYNIELKKGKKIIASNFITSPSCPLTAEEGTYTFSVTPYEEAEKYAIGETQTIEITLPYVQPDGLEELYSTPRQAIKVINGQEIIVQKNNHQYNILGNEQHK